MTAAALKVRAEADANDQSRLGRAKRRAIAVTQEALRYLTMPDAAMTSERRSRLRAAIRGSRREALDALPALVGQTLEHATRNGSHRHTVTTRDLATMRAVVEAVYWFAERRALVLGTLVAAVAVSRPMGTAIAARCASISPRSWSRWLPLLSAAGVVLYQHGQCRHPSLVGLPLLQRAHGGWAREALVRDQDREPAWWGPLLRSMLDDHGTPHAAVLALEAYRAEHEQQRAEKQAARDAAIVAAIRARDAKVARQVAAEAAEKARGIRAWAAAKSEGGGLSLQQELGTLKALRVAETRARTAALAVEARALGDDATALVLEIAARRPNAVSPVSSRCHRGNRNSALSSESKEPLGTRATRNSERAAPGIEGAPPGQDREPTTPAASAASRDRDGVARLLRLAAQASQEAGEGGGSGSSSVQP